MLSPQPNWLAAIVFYMLFVVGLLVFAVLPGLQADSFRRTLALGALFGLITYATYDLTNLATVPDWPLAVTLVDMTWGAVLAASVCSLGFAAGRWLS